MPSITLHPEKGVNPRVTSCKGCGNSVGLVMLGIADHMARCTACGQMNLGIKKGSQKCMNCGERCLDIRLPIAEHERLPIDVCDDCRTAVDRADAEVKAGGIYWRCIDCGSSGALRAESGLAKEARESLKMPTEPCGVEFTKHEGCPVCGGEQ